MIALFKEFLPHLKLIKKDKPLVNNINLIPRIWNQLSRRRKRQLSFSVLLIIFNGLSDLLSLASALPFLYVLSADPDKLWQKIYIRNLAAFFGINNPQHLLIPVTVIFIIAALLSGLIRLANLWFTSRISGAIASDFSCSIYKNNLYQPYKYHISKNSSEVITAITVHINSASAIILNTLQLTSSFVITLFIIVGIVFINWIIAISGIAIFGLIYLMIASKSKKRLNRNSKIVAQSMTLEVQGVQESIGSIRDIILDHIQDDFIRLHRNIDVPMRRVVAQNLFLALSPRYGLESLGLILISLLALLMSRSSQDPQSLVPVLGAMALGSQKLLPAFQQFYTSWASISTHVAGVEIVLSSLESNLEPKEFVRPINKKILLNDIQLKNLSFSFKPESEPVINKMNLTIKKGESIGLIGKTGNGKSTLLDIIMGFLEPDDGTILINNKNIHDKDHPNRLSDWRSSISHVPQNIFLTDASIAQNITLSFSKDKINEDKLKWAASQARISDFVESLENKYNTIVGERGVNISGGQRQRIGIARALYKESNILIFDEATSALDNETERAVIKAIMNISNDVTLIMVAHRLETIKNCKRVIKLEKGRIIKDGNPQDILSY